MKTKIQDLEASVDFLENQDPELARLLSENFYLLRTLLTLEDWHYVGAVNEPLFENGWDNAGVTKFQTAFRTDYNRFCHLKGVVSGGLIGDTIFTVPSNHHPAKEVNFPVVSDGAFGIVTITKTGQVQATSGTNGEFSLDGIVYSLD